MNDHVTLVGFDIGTTTSRAAFVDALVANNADNVDETAGPHGVVDQMRVVAKPEMNEGLTKFGRHRLDRER